MSRRCDCAARGCSKKTGSFSAGFLCFEHELEYDETLHYEYGGSGFKKHTAVDVALWLNWAEL